jgi:DNA binding domain, excisionase family
MATTQETTTPDSPRDTSAVRSLLTVEETAALLRIGRNTCYELLRQGQIPHIRLGRLIRVPRHAQCPGWARKVST